MCVCVCAGVCVCQGGERERERERERVSERERESGRERERERVRQREREREREREERKKDRERERERERKKQKEGWARQKRSASPERGCLGRSFALPVLEQELRELSGALHGEFLFWKVPAVLGPCPCDPWPGGPHGVLFECFWAPGVTRPQLGPFFVLKFVRSRVLGRDFFNRFQSP